LALGTVLAMSMPNPQSQARPNRSARRKLPEFVRWLVANLGLDPAVRYDLSPIRVSAKGRLDKLDDQEGTGIGVYADRKDFQALKLMDDVTQRGWLPITYAQLGGSSSRVFAWVGLVGTTIFVAAADSAVEANLEPDEDDIAGLGRNAYVELFIAAARAGTVLNILLPFLSRIWRNDLWAEMLMAAVNKHLPGCTVWEGKEELATYGSAKLITNVKGREGSAYAENFKEQVFEKGVQHIKAGGKWDRRESELPLGLERERIALPDGTTTKSMRVVETPHRVAAVAALEKRAQGGSWKQVGALLAEHLVPMPGTRGGNGRTFADYSTVSARTAGAKSILLSHLDYYRTGEWDELRTVALPNVEIRGIQLEHDPDTGRRYTTVRVTGMPWRPFLTDAQWADFDEHERADQAARKTGAAAREMTADERVAAFMGVSSWLDGDHQFTLVPDSPTAYRLRGRPPQDRGWDSGEGTIVATLRRTIFHTGCGRSLLEGLRAVEDQLAPPRKRTEPNDPIAAIQHLLADLERRIATATKASDVADRELEAADGDADEVEHWRTKGKEARAEVRSLERTLVDTRAELAAAVDRTVEAVESSPADIAEPVLLASLLLDGTKKVDPVVAELLDAYGITSSLRLDRPDPVTGAVRATATARLPLLDGTTFEVDLQWDTPNSHNTTGDVALLPAMIRAWADGHSFEQLAGRFPDHDARRVRKRLNEALRRGGMTVRGLRIAALKCPVPATRQVIAARILGDPALAAPHPEDFAQQVVAAYFHAERRTHTATWCDATGLDNVRRVLTSLGGDHQGVGTNVDLLARNTNVKQAAIRRMGRDELLDKAGPFAVRAKHCPVPGCRGLLTIYVPAPETGSGLVCQRCWRAENLDAVMGELYTHSWVRKGTGYVIAAPPAVAIARPARDRLLSVSEVATKLAISASGVRQLDAEGELIPAERTGQNSGRLYRQRDLDQVPATKVRDWRSRFGGPDDDGLLGTADVAAILECSPSLVRDFAHAGKLPVAATTPGGHRRFRRSDVDALDRNGVAAYALAEIGEAAGSVGLLTTTLRDLANAGAVPSAVTLLGQRRFDLGELRDALAPLGLLGSPENPIVSIGQLADHPAVAQSTGQLRRLADDGVIPTAGRVGGKRRFRLQDVLDALPEARTPGNGPVGAASTRGDRGPSPS
jgi:excisionase family DNA binding protein